VLNLFHETNSKRHWCVILKAYFRRIWVQVNHLQRNALLVLKNNFER